MREGRTAARGVSSPLLAGLLFCSGLVALVYETVWVKQMALVVGIDVYAVTTVVSGFFAGLGCGSAVLGVRADRVRRPLVLYAVLEIGVACGALLVTLALPFLPPLYLGATAAVGTAAWALPFLMVAAPAFLMGGTLPAAVRAAAPAPERVGAVTGWLYAINTAGGVAGALATVLVLVPALGVRGTGVAAAALSAAVAVVAARGGSAAPAAVGARASAAAPVLPLALYAIAGAVALGYEVVWTQAAVPFLNTRAYAFALVLATYLTGLVVGSIGHACLIDRLRRPWVAFGVVQFGVGAAALAAFAVVGPWLPDAQRALGAGVAAASGSLAAGLAAQLLLVPAVLVLVPTILLGAAFPAAARLVCGPDHVGRDVGAVAAVNTLGGIAGTALTGFVAVPALGLRGTLLSLSLVAAAVGAVAITRGASRRGRAALAAGLAVLALAGAGAAIPRDHLTRPFLAAHPGTLVAFEESPGGTVAVVDEPFFASSFRRLYVHGVSNSNDGLMSRRYMRLQALLPLAVHTGESRSALVIGLGTGITCGALLAWPGLEHRVCVELLPAVVRAAPRFAGNYGVVGDPRVELRIADGRHDLLRRDDRYDVITLEPPPPTAAGVVNLYSRDFYALAARRLAPRGLLAQWLPLATQTDRDTRMLVRTFVDVFPAATLWSTEMHEMLLLGSMEPLVLDAGTLARRLAEPTVAAALAEVGVPDVASLLATYVTDRSGLEEYAGDAPVVTDDRPRIEHAALVRGGEFVSTLANLLANRREPVLAGGDEALAARVRARRDGLVAFYQAGVYWYAGRREEMEPLLRRLLEDEPTNPYYRWFVGG